MHPEMPFRLGVVSLLAPLTELFALGGLVQPQQCLSQVFLL
jgi:hypothetical protein